MKIILNNQPVEIADQSINIQELLISKGMKTEGTAVSVNNRLVRHSDWGSCQIKDGDNIVIISAAFGG